MENKIKEYIIGGLIGSIATIGISNYLNSNQLMVLNDTSLVNSQDIKGMIERIDDNIERNITYQGMILDDISLVNAREIQNNLEDICVTHGFKTSGIKNIGF